LLLFYLSRAPRFTTNVDMDAEKKNTNSAKPPAEQHQQPSVGQQTRLRPPPLTLQEPPADLKEKPIEREYATQPTASVPLAAPQAKVTLPADAQKVMCRKKPEPKKEVIVSRLCRTPEEEDEMTQHYAVSADVAKRTLARCLERVVSPVTPCSVTRVRCVFCSERLCAGHETVYAHVSQCPQREQRLPQLLTLHWAHVYRLNTLYRSSLPDIDFLRGPVWQCNGCAVVVREKNSALKHARQCSRSNGLTIRGDGVLVTNWRTLCMDSGSMSIFYEVRVGLLGILWVYLCVCVESCEMYVWYVNVFFF
jgi:hypothetical protein